MLSSVTCDSVTATVDSLRAADNSLEPCSLNESEVELDAEIEADSETDTDALSETDVDATFSSETDSDTEASLELHYLLQQ